MSTDGVKDSMSAAVLEKHQETVVKLVIVEFGRIIPQSQVQRLDDSDGFAARNKGISIVSWIQIEAQLSPSVTTCHFPHFLVV
jgi:hypothetical protein